MLKGVHNRLVSAGVKFVVENKVVKYLTKNGEEFARIENGTFVITKPKGSRQEPIEYLKEEYISGYLSKFEKEGTVSRIVLKDAYLNYGIGKPDNFKTEFVSLKSEIDQLLKNSKGDLDILSKVLGVPKEQLSGGLVRVDFKLTSKNKVFIPSGNEFGANSQWLPGGVLPTGQIEGVVRTKDMVKGVDYTVTDIVW